MGTKIRVFAGRYLDALRLRRTRFEGYDDGAPAIRSVDGVVRIDGVSTAPQRWNLGALEAHVQRKLAESPERLDRIEEWRYYLIYLRSYAEMDGSLPTSLDGLVADVFGAATPASLVPVYA